MVSKRAGAPSGGSAKKQRLGEHVVEDLEEKRRQAREWAALALGSVNSPKKPAAAKTPKGKSQPPRRETPPLPPSPSPSPPRVRANSVYERALAKEKAQAAAAAAAGEGSAGSGTKQPPAAPRAPAAAAAGGGSATSGSQQPPAAPRAPSSTPPRAGGGRFMSASAYEKARAKEQALLAKQEEAYEAGEVYAPPALKSAASRSSAPAPRVQAESSSAYQRARAREESGTKPVKTAPLPRQQSPVRGPRAKWEGGQLTVWDRAGDYAKMLAAALFCGLVAFFASRLLV